MGNSFTWDLLIPSPDLTIARLTSAVAFLAEHGLTPLRQADNSLRLTGLDGFTETKTLTAQHAVAHLYGNGGLITFEGTRTAADHIDLIVSRDSKSTPAELQDLYTGIEFHKIQLSIGTGLASLSSARRLFEYKTLHFASAIGAVYAFSWDEWSAESIYLDEIDSWESGGRADLLVRGTATAVPVTSLLAAVLASTTETEITHRYGWIECRRGPLVRPHSLLPRARSDHIERARANKSQTIGSAPMGVT